MNNSILNKDYFISEFLKYNKKFLRDFKDPDICSILHCNTAVSINGKIKNARFSTDKLSTVNPEKLYFISMQDGYNIFYGDESYFIPIEHILYLCKNKNDFQYQVLYPQTVHDSIAIFKFLLEFLLIEEDHYIDIFNTNEYGNESICAYKRNLS